jgi:hypothetical protein
LIGRAGAARHCHVSATMMDIAHADCAVDVTVRGALAARPSLQSWRVSMRKFALLASCLLLSTNVYAALPHDIGGITVGSSKDAVIKKFGKNAVFKDYSSKANKACGNYYALITINGREGEILFQNNVVSSASITLVDEAVDMTKFYAEIVKKYGEPDEKNMHYDAIESMSWHFGNQTTKFNGEKFYIYYRDKNYNSNQIDISMACQEKFKANALPNI